MDKESGSMMLLHAIAIGLLLFGMMVLAGQDRAKAEDRSVALGAVILLYMVVFGHNLPTQINQNLK
tara:strand:- start:1179 stop:1376 length:198 start_codon:yes stop_codon:yes gene_type:complete